MAEAEEKKNKYVVIYPLVISTIALFVSLVSIYFTYFRVSHSLQLGVIKSDVSDNEIPADFMVDLILLNKGNQTESLLNAELQFVAGDSLVFTKSRKGPLVLKPGDALPLRVETNLGKGVFDVGAKWSGTEGHRKAETEMVLQISSVDMNGRQVTKKITLGNFVYEELNNYFSYRESAPKELSLVELTR
jgi:hypothetical protein